MVRGFGFTPRAIEGDNAEDFQAALSENIESPFYIMHTEKGYGGPNRYHESHQIPLKHPMTDKKELKELEEWLKSYHPETILDEITKGEGE